MNSYRLSSAVGIIVLMLSLSMGAINQATASDWIPYWEDTEGNEWSYNKTSLYQPSPPLLVLKVWVKQTLSPRGRTSAIAGYAKAGLSTDGLEALKERRALYFLNIKDETYAITNVADVLDNGKIFNEVRMDLEWKSIMPDTLVHVTLITVATQWWKDHKNK
jgi:hypothetical protein